MNKPDEKTLNRWLNGELEGEELSQVETWAEQHAGDLDAEFKCSIGWDALNDECMSSIAASEEPPYPEFFNHKIQQAIENEAHESSFNETPAAQAAPDNVISSPGIWQKLRWMVLPTAAAAAIAFYAGSNLTQSPANSDRASSGLVASYDGVYTPDSGVVAAVSESESATEIVLEGLKPISDALDIAHGETSQGDSPYMMASMVETMKDIHDSIIFY